LLELPLPIITIPEIYELFQKVHDMALKTYSDALMIIVRNGRVFSYATDKLSPLVGETDGRALVVKMLYDYYKGDLFSFKPDESEGPFNVDYPDLRVIIDDDERHNYLVQNFMAIREKFLPKLKPNPNGAEGLFLVATLAKQILQMASPGLKPLVGTSEGQKVIQTLLNNPYKGRNNSDNESNNDINPNIESIPNNDSIDPNSNNPNINTSFNNNEENK